MSFSQAAEVATRTGAMQTVAPKNVKSNRESDSSRQPSYVNPEDGEENHGFGAEATALSTPQKKTAKQRNTRRRRASGMETRGKEESREVTGRRKTSETEETQRSEKAEKAKKARPRRGADWTPSQGLRTAQNVLHQQSLLNQASIQFEQSRGDQHQAMTPFGQQQAMLDSLINMTEMLYHQHTGDKAGEIYNRPATRQILTALKGLKDGGTKTETAAPSGEVRKLKKREFRAQMARIEKAHVALQPQVLPADYEPLDLVA